jgi:CRP-like cAMP-binding protein
MAEDLKQVPLFSDLSQRQLRQLAGQFMDRRVAAGTRLVTQGEMSGVGFFVVAEGEAAVFVDGLRVGTVKRGDHFGELAMISQGVRTATVQAATPMLCRTIQFWNFRAFAKKNPDVMWKLLQHVAAVALNEQSRRGAQAGTARP